MTRRMLVDATHPEEIRVAITQDNRLVDLDIETANKEQIKGNIYLGRVSRVEPSLQAAFIEFHGGRQGFLSVNDIHPKYFTPGGLTVGKDAPVVAPPVDDDDSGDDEDADTDEGQAAATSATEIPEAVAAETRIPGEELVSLSDTDATTPEPGPSHEEVRERDGDEEEEEDRPPAEEIRRQHRRRPPPIQKILQRNQTVLVQVVKESRGNKGATLTTNLSLAGRYTVLLPENPGGGGISRKITDIAERKNLKSILNGLAIPPEMSLIIRTAGMERNKREFSRDISYLTRLWKMILEGAKTKKAPCLIHEEGDLIIRTIRDLYTTDMEEILIEGQEGYRMGKDFMRLLMPRYVKVVQPYRESVPIFARYQVESQIETMHERVVQLKAGSYLVIDPTEALVTIDINSGRSTREKDVESTAFKTNLQAVDEIARQLRVRDLGGLVVIDFIDMEDRKHIQEVEKRVKDAFKSDRAKVQIGRISQFGLLELSRQRLRPTFSETNRIECPRCKGLGTIRSVESAAIYTYRCIEEEVSQGKYQVLNYQVSSEVVNYLFNHKRASLVALEESNQVTVNIHADVRLQPPEFTTNHLEKNKKDKPREEKSKIVAVTPPESSKPVQPSGELVAQPPVAPATATPASVPDHGTVHPPAVEQTGEAGKKKRRRRRRRKKNPGAVDATPVNGLAQGGEMAQGDEDEDSDEPQNLREPTPPAPVPQQDMRQVEALAMRFPGLYTLHDVNPTKTTEESSLLADDDDDAFQDQMSVPQIQEASAVSNAQGDAAAKRKRSRRGGRGRGRKKPNLVEGSMGGHGDDDNLGNSDGHPHGAMLPDDADDSESIGNHLLPEDHSIASDWDESR
ncbi:MAG: ribonuclease E/G [Magnetococcales bacterium]|nr:ribonuclease E/G [Magnetococcales bacterium]